MGLCKTFFLFASLLTVAFLGYFYHRLTYIPELPKLDLEKWWGPGASKNIDKSIRPFKVEFTDTMVADLKSRLSDVFTTTPLEGTGFEYGFNNDYLKEVIQFWRTDYNFKEREAFLNKYPQYKTNIQGLDIHFLHVKPKVTQGVRVVPLLMLHGWPGSVREFYETIPLLTTPREEYDFVFEVIVPSLPGYGFSQAAAKPGLGADQISIIMRNLMLRLGFKQFYVQGGDWGALVVQLMSMFFPKEVLAMHTNMAFVRSEMSLVKTLLGSIFPSLVVADEYKDRMYPYLDKIQVLLEEMGYMHLQATKPDTAGMAVNNSPAGLAAYILEKFSVWTNLKWKSLRDGGLTKKFPLTRLLDNIMIYWTTHSITTSMRLYSETFNKRFEALTLDNIPIPVPTAIANFRHELLYVSEFALKDKFPHLVHMSHFEDGGHFAAFELPEVFAEDVWVAFKKLLKASDSRKNQRNEL